TGRSLKADRNMNCFINLTYFSVRLLILSLSDPKISSLPSSAHTYRLLIFKEHSARNVALLSSAAFSAAEKRDYEPCFAARQQLFNCFVATAGSIFVCCSGSLPPTPQQHRFPLPRRVSVSAKEA
ncbi:hypothetical protein, partial [Burkholderia pyrrocinia]|uniref:hypothetical protein n=1 Tax=Burkholderia pyrrocinia TaxID=60550 RepID=UPI001ABB8BDC